MGLVPIASWNPGISTGSLETNISSLLIIALYFNMAIAGHRPRLTQFSSAIKAHNLSIANHSLTTLVFSIQCSGPLKFQIEETPASTQRPYPKEVSLLSIWPSTQNSNKLDNQSALEEHFLLCPSKVTPGCQESFLSFWDLRYNHDTP